MKKQGKIKKKEKNYKKKININRNERNQRCDRFFLFRVTPFSFKKIWKYRESINVSCKAMDKPFDP